VQAHGHAAKPGKDSKAKSGKEVHKYLPKQLNGETVLVPVGPNLWQTQNTIGATTRGLGFRGSKDLSDFYGGHTTVLRDEIVFWGESIQGHDEGDGWIRCSFTE